jgi:hypothetical protein
MPGAKFFNMTTKPKVIFVLAERSWLRWLPGFLQHPHYQAVIHHLDVHEGRDTAAELVRPGADAIVLLSHHTTLLRDARLGEQLIALGAPHVIFQSEPVARLALNKRQMAEVARCIPGCHALPELSGDEAREYLSSNSNAAVVSKSVNSTEGRTMEVARSTEMLDAIPCDGLVGPDRLLQPFLDGLEYSVNLVCGPGRCITFEPVCKGRTSPDGLHPCRRLRYCPCLFTDTSLRKRLLKVSRCYARGVGAMGLVEIELIVSNNRIFLLEINPRLSATMRMASIACGRSIFADTPLLFLNPCKYSRPARPVTFTAELPVPRDADLQRLLQLQEHMPLWLSSRVTTAAPDRLTLRRHMLEIAACMGLPYGKGDLFSGLGPRA